MWNVYGKLIVTEYFCSSFCWSIGDTALWWWHFCSIFIAYYAIRWFWNLAAAVHVLWLLGLVWSHFIQERHFSVVVGDHFWQYWWPFHQVLPCLKKKVRPHQRKPIRWLTKLRLAKGLRVSKADRKRALATTRLCHEQLRGSPHEEKNIGWSD